jgi:hypothetical protein
VRSSCAASGPELARCVEGSREASPVGRRWPTFADAAKELTGIRLRRECLKARRKPPSTSEQLKFIHAKGLGDSPNSLDGRKMIYPPSLDLRNVRRVNASLRGEVALR